MRVALWDVRIGGRRKPPVLERTQADVLLLLGVSASSARAWTAEWQEWNCADSLSTTGSRQQRPHGAMIASRWPLRDIETYPDLPKPERALLCVADTPAGPVTLVSWGAPNAAGEGREAKERAYALMSALLSQRAGPIIVGVDTNAWSDPPLHGTGAPGDPLWKEQDDFTGRDPRHGLSDVFRTLVDGDPPRAELLASMRPHGPLAVTYIRRPHGRPRGIVQRDGSAFGLTGWIACTSQSTSSRWRASTSTMRPSTPAVITRWSSQSCRAHRARGGFSISRGRAQEVRRRRASSLATLPGVRTRTSEGPTYVVVEETTVGAGLLGIDDVRVLDSVCATTRSLVCASRRWQSCGDVRGEVGQAVAAPGGSCGRPRLLA